MRKFNIFFAAILFFALMPGQANAIKMVSVKQDMLNMRSGPGMEYSIIFKLDKGYPLRVIGSQGKWLKVSDFEKDVGWVYKPLVTDSPHLVVKAGQDDKAKVNIRSGPGVNYQIVGKAEYGVVLKTLKRSKEWVKVRHAEGLTGWVKRDLLWGW